MMQKRPIIIVFLAVLAFYASGAAYKPSSSDLARPNDLPVIGKWMIAPSGRPANWLGIKFQGKEMREPINIVIVDSISKTPEDSIARIYRYCAKAGYRDRRGHSWGYSGYIGGALYAQLPRTKGHAFSNRPYEVGNDHGRIFGPYMSGGKFYFIASFSREVLGTVGRGITHKYGSFRLARNEFADLVSRKTALKISSYVFLDNKISSGALTTGDHDGYSIVLQN